ncbi:MAG: nuclear transport factor 2 family protein, partial [Nocardioidaceae bacterium]
ANTGYIQFILTGVSVSFADEHTAVVTCTENVLAEAAGESADTFAGGKAVATNVFVHARRGWLLWMRHASPVVIVEEGEDE